MQLLEDSDPQTQLVGRRGASLARPAADQETSAPELGVLVD